MKNKRPWIIATFAALLALVAGLVMTLREPSYQGKSLTEWLVQYYDTYGSNQPDRPGVERQRAGAREAIHRLGPQGLPTLVNWLTARENWMSRARAKISERLGIHYLAPDRRSELALFAFMELDARAQGAVPELIRRFDEDPISVGSALACIGPAAAGATATVARGLTNQNPDLRVQTVEILPRIQTNAEVVVPMLIRMLDDDASFVRQRAHDELRKFRGQAGSSAPALRHRLAAAINPEDKRQMKETVTVVAGRAHVEFTQLEYQLAQGNTRAVLQDWAVGLMNAAGKSDYLTPEEKPAWLMTFYKDREPEVYCDIRASPRVVSLTWSGGPLHWGYYVCDPGASYERLSGEAELLRLGDGVCAYVKAR